MDAYMHVICCQFKVTHITRYLPYTPYSAHMSPENTHKHIVIYTGG